MAPEIIYNLIQETTATSVYRIRSLAAIRNTLTPTEKVPFACVVYADNLRFRCNVTIHDLHLSSVGNKHGCYVVRL